MKNPWVIAGLGLLAGVALTLALQTARDDAGSPAAPESAHETDIPRGPTENRWQTYMDRIESGVLRSGTNTIQLRRASGEDNFVVRDVVVQWRRAA